MNVLVYIIQPSIPIKTQVHEVRQANVVPVSLDSDQCHTHILTNNNIFAATQPNEPHQCILTHFNNCNFSKAQIVCSLMMVFYKRNM